MIRKRHKLWLAAALASVLTALGSSSAQAADYGGDGSPLNCGASYRVGQVFPIADWTGRVVGYTELRWSYNCGGVNWVRSWAAPGTTWAEYDQFVYEASNPNHRAQSWDFTTQPTFSNYIRVSPTAKVCFGSSMRSSLQAPKIGWAVSGGVHCYS